MRIEEGTNNRGVIYFFYDRQGVVDTYVSYMLRELKRCVRNIYVVVNGTLTEEGRARFSEFADAVWERENKGLDVGAYRYALEKIGWETIKEYDELILMNHTIMGPVFPLREMFDEMGNRDLDFWGVSIHYGADYDPFGLTECGYLRAHLQSHFIVARNSLLSGPDYREYWEKLPPISTYNESVAYHESYFTHHFESLGYRWDAYAAWEGLKEVSEHPILKLPVELMQRVHCPFFKRRSFMHDYDDFLHSTCGEPSVKLLGFLKEKTNYDVDLIWENMLRCENQSDIQKCLSLNYIVSSKKSTDVSEILKKRRVALIYHFYYEDSLGECVYYSGMMPKEADLYITTDTEEKKRLLEKGFQSFENKVEVRLIENRGRDVSALLIGARDLISQYDYICFAHDKKVTQLRPFSQGSSWSRKCFENILKNRNVVNNILRLMEENPRLGMLSPAPPNHGAYYGLIGSEWTVNFPNVKKLAEKLEIQAPMSEGKPPIAPIGTMFWFKGRALKKLIEMDWQYEDFPEEPADSDGTVSHAVERLYPFVVQDAGFYPAYVFCQEGAALEINNLQYMLRGFNQVLFDKGLKGAYYTDTCNLLQGTVSHRNGRNFLTPTLYLDHGEGYNEQNTLRSDVSERKKDLRVLFKLPFWKRISHVRFDPCEEEGICLKNLQIFRISLLGKRKPLPLENCSHNGLLSGERIIFKNSDPWINISWRRWQRPFRLEICAEVEAEEM